MHKKTLQGEVISDKMTKTVVVRVVFAKRHPKYHKRFTIFKKYKAHDEKGEFHTGDIVEIEESNPISRQKRWKVIKKIK